MADDDWYKPHGPPRPPRQAQPGELLFEFHVSATHTFWRVELRDHGEYGVEAQFLDPVEVRIASISDWTRRVRRARWRSRGLKRSGGRLNKGRDSNTMTTVIVKRLRRR